MAKLATELALYGPFASWLTSVAQFLDSQSLADEAATLLGTQRLVEEGLWAYAHGNGKRAPIREAESVMVLLNERVEQLKSVSPIDADIWALAQSASFTSNAIALNGTKDVVFSAGKRRPLSGLVMTTVFLECCALSLHWVARRVGGYKGAGKHLVDTLSGICDDLAQPVLQHSAADEGFDISPIVEGQVEEFFKVRQPEYARLPEFRESEESGFGGTLYWEFGEVIKDVLEGEDAKAGATVTFSLLAPAALNSDEMHKALSAVAKRDR